MGDLNPSARPSRRFPPRPESVPLARRFVRTALGEVAPELADTAELLVSELVTNAVLHARTEVEVSAWPVGGGFRVRVGDRRTSRGVVPPGHRLFADTRQGLALVERLATRHGVDVGDEWKTVWCESRPDEAASPPSGWGLAVPAASATVTLVDLPGTLCSASQQHRDALLAELALVAAAGHGIGVPPPDFVTAHDMNNVIGACVAAAAREHPSEADTGFLPLLLPADAAPAVRTLCRVLDQAEEAARDARLLTLPAPPLHRAFHQWFFDQITRQLAGEQPTAWTVVSREPGVGPSDLVPWQPAHVHDSRLPTIAADDRNRIIAVNAPAADLLGWHEDELLGQRLTVVMPEHLRERHVAAFTSLLLTGRPRILGRSVPLPALHRDGRLVPVRLLIQVHETADGRTVFVAQLTPRAVATPTPRAPGRSRQVALQGPGRLYPPAVQGPGERASGGAADTSELERLSLLADTTAALSNTPDLYEGLRRVGGLLTQRLADWCAVDLRGEGDQVDRVCVVHRDPAGLRPEAYEGRLPPASEAAQGPLARALQGAGPLLLTEIPSPSEARSALDADHLELFAGLVARSAVVAPLRAHREVLGALTVARTSGRRPFAEEDLALIDDLARGLAPGVDNARLHQETRNIAERLQHTLLPVLPEVEHLGMTARYASSSTTAQVGGDWYDSFVVPGGDTALVIGDVTGHDLEAAVAMSQLRSMLRGIAIDCAGPPEGVVRRLDKAQHSLYQEATATCVYGLVKGRPEGPWVLEYASAGHLPPLLTTWDGDTRYLDEGAGLLLGMDPDMPRSGATAPLPARSTLLLYTDGLIERRGASLDHGMALLRRHTADLAREPLDVFCDELLIGLGADNSDDIAVLALRPAPPS